MVQNETLDLRADQRQTRQGPEGFRFVNPYFLRATPSGPAGYGAAFLEEAVLSLVDSDSPRTVALPSLEDAFWATSMAEAAAESAGVRGRRPVMVLPPPPYHL